MKTLRTPDERFDALPGYDFEPHYVTIPDGDGGELRVHYVDEGPSSAPPVLLMHGEPTWAYLYRNVVPNLVEAGHRCVVPDLVGFGRSDKPTEQSDHTYARHVAWMRAALLDALDLRSVTFFGQDWGGLIGLRVLTSDPDRFDRVVVGNTGLPTGDGTPNDAFLAWQSFAATTEEFPVGAIINGGCTSDLDAEVIAAYDAPFPDDSFKAGPRVMPSLVPTGVEDPARDDQLAAWEVLSTFERPFLCAFSDSDPITKGGDKPFRERVPGAAGQTHVTIEGGGHFLQEDRPVDVAGTIHEFINATPAD